MLEKCLGQNRDGTPCSAQAAPGRQFCQWHDPARETERAEWRQKGGKARSNAMRARKKLAGVSDIAGVQATLHEAMAKVVTGEMEPGPANALANLARAIVTVSGVADFEQQLVDLRRDIAEMSEKRA